MNQYLKDVALRRGVVKSPIVAVLVEATIMRVGWESDNKGWVVRCEDGTVKALTTDHGNLCQWSGQNMHETLELTKQSVAELEEAIRVMVNK